MLVLGEFVVGIGHSHERHFVITRVSRGAVIDEFTKVFDLVLDEKAFRLCRGDGVLFPFVVVKDGCAPLIGHDRRLDVHSALQSSRLALAEGVVAVFVKVNGRDVIARVDTNVGSVNEVVDDDLFLSFDVSRDVGQRGRMGFPVIGEQVRRPIVNRDLQRFDRVVAVFVLGDHVVARRNENAVVVFFRLGRGSRRNVSTHVDHALRHHQVLGHLKNRRLGFGGLCLAVINVVFFPFPFHDDGLFVDREGAGRSVVPLRKENILLCGSVVHGCRYAVVTRILCRKEIGRDRDHVAADPVLGFKSHFDRLIRIGKLTARQGPIQTKRLFVDRDGVILSDRLGGGTRRNLGIGTRDHRQSV